MKLIGKMNKPLKDIVCDCAVLLSLPLVAFFSLSSITCGTTERETDERIGVAVTILPQVEFAERVGGERVDVTAMIPAGASPHTYEPKPSQVREVAEAEIYAKVGSGIDFELNWMDDLIEQNDDILVVDCSSGVRLIETEGAPDPHIWTSPVNAKIMVRNICEGLVAVDSQNQSFYEANRDAYIEEITQIDREIREGLEGIKNRRFMVYHPAFGYFADEYGLTMLTVEEEGKEPTASSLSDLIDEAREYQIEVIFVEPQFNPKSAEVIADEIGGRVVTIDPLAEDYAVNLSRVMNCIVEATERNDE